MALQCEVGRHRDGACPRGDVQEIAPRDWVRAWGDCRQPRVQAGRVVPRPLARAPRMGHPAPNGEVQRRIGPVRARTVRALVVLLGVLVVALGLPLGGCLLIFPRRLAPVSQPQSSSSSGPKAPASPWPGPVSIHTSGSGDELSRGITDADGRFSSSMSIGDDVRSVRVVVEAPPGFVVPASTSRLLEVALSSWDEPVTVRLAPESLIADPRASPRGIAGRDTFGDPND